MLSKKEYPSSIAAYALQYNWAPLRPHRACVFVVKFAIENRLIRDGEPVFSRPFLLSKIFLTWTYHKQKWLIQILGLKLSQNRSQDHFGTWYAHVKKIFDKRKKAWKKLALHRGSTGFRLQIWQQSHMHGAVLVEPNYIEVHKLWYWNFAHTQNA